jgi:hypothetical protein
MVEFWQVLVLNIATVKSVWETENIIVRGSEGFSGADGFKEI